VSPASAASSISEIINTLLEVLYVSYPHGLDLHMQVLLETSSGNVEFQLMEFDFSQSIPKSEVRDLLVKGFSKILDPTNSNSVTEITKLIILGYSGDNPLAEAL